MFARHAEATPLERPVELGEQIGSWRVEQIVSEEAGLRAVYLVSDGERQGALVLVPEAAGQARDFVRRFKRLVRARRSLNHPNLLPLLDGGESHHGVYVVSAPSDAPSLAQVVDEGPLEPTRAVRLLAQVASALDAGVGSGLIHRELTPRAIRVDRDDHVLVGDFGIGRPRSGSGMLEVLEWPEYISPEEIRADPMSERSNIYSLACILFECLAGSPPFASEWHQAVAHAHLSEDPPRVSERRSGLPSEIDAVLVRGLAKQPADRYETTSELIDAAAAALGIGDHTAAEPAPAQAPRPTRGRAIRTAVVTLLACGAVGGGLGWVLGSSQDDPARAPSAAAERQPAQDTAGLRAARERAAWQTRANAAIRRLGRTRARTRRRLAGADTKAAQAVAALALARGFDRTARALSGPPGARQRILRRAARRAARGYRRMARAAQGGAPGNWRRARASVRRAERTFRRTAARL